VRERYTSEQNQNGEEKERGKYRESVALVEQQNQWARERRDNHREPNKKYNNIIASVMWAKTH
jgi:hypothetical protein